MQVIFRADASIHIGSGHIMRCLTLADGLRNKGYGITFVCRELPGNLISLIKAKSYSVYALNWQDENNIFNWYKDVTETINVIESNGLKTDLLIVDHYQLDSVWESAVRDYTKKIMVIDDLADRKHDCDILLDQNYYRDLNTRYHDLTPENSLKLLGPKYALLRKDFGEARKSIRNRSGEIKTILISFGGGDCYKLTLQAIKAIVKLKQSKISVDVVIGKANPYKSEIIAQCDSLAEFTLHIQTSRMADLMMKADLAIGAGGATSWERCVLGLPSILISLADNQVAICNGLAELEGAFYLGKHQDINDNILHQFLKKIVLSPNMIRNMANTCVNILDANGCDRLVSFLVEE